MLLSQTHSLTCELSLPFPTQWSWKWLSFNFLFPRQSPGSDHHHLPARPESSAPRLPMTSSVTGLAPCSVSLCWRSEVRELHRLAPGCAQNKGWSLCILCLEYACLRETSASQLSLFIKKHGDVALIICIFLISNNGEHYIMYMDPCLVLFI